MRIRKVMCRKVSKKGRTGQKRKKPSNTRNSDGVTWLRKILWLMYNVKYALMKDGGLITWKLRIPQIYSSVMVIIKILTIFSTTNVQYPVQLPATHSSIQSFFFFFLLWIFIRHFGVFAVLLSLRVLKRHSGIHAKTFRVKTTRSC